MQRIVRIRSGKKTVYYRDPITGEKTPEEDFIAKVPRIIKSDSKEDIDLKIFWNSLVPNCKYRNEKSQYRADCTYRHNEVIIKDCYVCLCRVEEEKAPEIPGLLQN